MKLYCKHSDDEAVLFIPMKEESRREARTGERFKNDKVKYYDCPMCNRRVVAKE